MVSAFYDIWIDGKGLIPIYGRYNGHEWRQKDIGERCYWYSKSSQSKAITSVLDTDQFHLLVLGQFYENVDLDLLAHKCLAYANSTRMFDEPAGHYLIFLFERENSKLHVFTNRLGTYHAYYSSVHNLLGTCYLGMAKQSSNKELDWEGISGFLSMGYFPGNSTYLSSIKILEPASYYRFDSEMNMEYKSRYWNWFYNPEHKSLGDLYKRLDDTMRSSLDFALQGKKVAIPISGGLDSRTLAGIIAPSVANKASLWGFSYGYTANSVETTIARKIASTRNIPFNAYTVPNYLFDNIELVSGAVELFQYIDGTRQAGVRDELAARSEVVACGHWGDVWLDDMSMEKYPSFEVAFQKKIIKRGSDWLQQNIVENFLPDAGDVLKDSISAFRENYACIKDQDFLMKIYKTDNWSFRWTVASLRMYQAASFPVLPFYDKRIVDLFTTIPSDVLKARELQIGYLRNYHPDLARITWQEYGRNLYAYKGFNNRHIVYRAVNKLKRSISGSRTIIRNWELFYLNPEGRRGLEEILLDESFTSIISKQKMQEFISEFYRNPSAANGYTMSMLHTLSRFIKCIS